MSAKVEQSSTSGAVTSTASTAAGVKISKFATKSGFLIPKNKLSGSLIPIFRGNKKGSLDASKEENDKLVQRKTKWGPDLTQDTAVKKGRALAYQTRVDQITQELRLGKLDTGDSQDLMFSSQDIKKSDNQLNSQELEVLELERREAIGEILRLNPSYKVPADYKPLLKEAKVPIPVTEYPAHNFTGLIFGPANDTHRRLEKETGAKIQVFGTKADTGLEVQVSSSDGNDNNGGYNEMHVHVSADTYEKVDAAVALIELLLMPVSGNPTSASTSSVSGASMHGAAPSTDIPGVLVSGEANEGSGPAAAQLNNFPQSGGSWFSVGANKMPIIPSPRFAVTSNPLQMPLFNPAMFGPQSVMPGGFNPVPQSPSLVPSGPRLPQGLQHQFVPQPSPPTHTGAPRNMFMPGSTGPAPVMPHFPDQPQAPTGWSNAASENKTPMGSGNMIPASVPWGQSPTALHPLVVSVAPPQNVSPIPQHSAGAAINHPIGVPFFNSSSHSQMGISPSPLLPAVAAPMQPVIPQVPMANSSLNTAFPGSNPLLSPMKPSSAPPVQPGGLPISGSGGGAVNFNPMKPPHMSGLRPQQPSSNDFTFQPHRPQNSEFEMAGRPDVRQPPQGPPNPFFQPAIRNFRPPPSGHVFSRPDMGSLGGQSSLEFPGPPRHVASPNAAPSIQTRNFNLPPSHVNAAGFPRARGPLPFQQHHPAAATRPPNFAPPSQQFDSNMLFNRPPRSSSGAHQQVYDPFSPSSASRNQQLSSNNGGKTQKQDSDPEYDDLMASVGVK